MVFCVIAVAALVTVASGLKFVGNGQDLPSESVRHMGTFEDKSLMIAKHGAPRALVLPKDLVVPEDGRYVGKIIGQDRWQGDVWEMGVFYAPFKHANKTMDMFYFMEGGREVYFKVDNKFLTLQNETKWERKDNEFISHETCQETCAVAATDMSEVKKMKMLGHFFEGSIKKQEACESHCDLIYPADIEYAFINTKQDESLSSSYLCPHGSMHMAIYDGIPRGFKLRYTDPSDDRVYAKLPQGCNSFMEKSSDRLRPYTPERASLQLRQKLRSERLALIPYPASVVVSDHKKPFVIGEKNIITLENIDRKADDRTDLAMHHMLEHLGKVASKDGGAGEIVLRMDPNMTHDEGYKLEVTSDKVTLSAKDPAGLLYGVQTFKQLARDSSAPACLIEDAPRFGWRGLHLDVSRHFFPAEDVKKLLDTMTAFKLNHFHWHLTDDQGWRIPIDGYPALTELGAENALGVKQSYTHDEIKDVIQHAASRNIEVVPEVDVPGHAAAAISAYPFLGNTDIPNWSPPARPPTTYGAIHPYTISPTTKSFDFLTKVFDSVADTFPSNFIHIGGDEAPREQWAKSKEATSLMRQVGGNQVQAIFNEKIGEVLKDKKKTAVAWDETQHIGGLPKDAVIMAWRSSSELRQAVRSGHRAVQADQASYYFDHYQAQPSDEPKAIGGYLPLDQVYNNDPMPPGLSEHEQSLVLGGQAQLWSEYFPTWKQVEYMAHPRSLALAERLWSPNTAIKDFEEFKDRLKKRLPDLDDMGVNYRKVN